MVGAENGPTEQDAHAAVPTLGRHYLRSPARLAIPDKVLALADEVIK